MYCLKSWKLFAAAAVIYSALVMTGWGQIPGLGGMVVFDPSNLGEAVTQTTHLVTQINKAIETIRIVTSQYEHMKYMAQFVSNQYKYHAASTLWRLFDAPDTYGKNRAWIGAVNREPMPQVAGRMPLCAPSPTRAGRAPDCRAA